MTDGTDLTLQKAIVAILSADSNLGELVGVPARIYEQVIEDPSNLPYITIGESQDIDDSVQCQDDATETFIDLHIWTVETTFATNKRIANLVRSLIHHQEDSLTMDEGRCVLIERRITRHFRDSDPTIKHGVVTFRALLEGAN